MLQYTKAKGIGGADWLGLVTRDCPNVIIRTQNSAIQRIPGDAWAWSVYTQLTAGLGYDFLLRQLIACTGIGLLVTLDASPHLASFGAIEHIQLATYINQAYTPIAEAQIAESGYFGYPAGEGSLALIVTTSRDIPIAPVSIPANTRIDIRTTIDKTLNRKMSNFFLSGYNLSTFGFTDIAAIDKAYEQGTPVCYPKLIPLAASISVVHDAAANILGSYSVVSASLDDDYLIWGGAAVQDMTHGSAVDAQFDVSLGVAGSEVVQARYAIVQPSTFFGASHCIFPWPFIAYAGERLAVRVSDEASAGNDYEVSLYGVKL